MARPFEKRRFYSKNKRIMVEINKKDYAHGVRYSITQFVLVSANAYYHKTIMFARTLKEALNYKSQMLRDRY